jgi:hypothetical protein
MTQQEALDILKLGHNVYLTGSAGSGKTYVLNQYISYLRKHGVDVGITASTGIAATHMNGTTIHSWSGLGIRDRLSPYDLEALEEKRYLWDRIQSARVLIIDEVSMLHHFRLDLVDEICKMFRRNDKPFGGLQVILCGDFFQLPPVSRTGEEIAQFIHRSQCWESMDLKVCYLHEQHRQNDQEFLEVLNAIRANSVSTETLNLLTARFNKEPESAVQPTRLYTHNIDVDVINNAELDKLPGDIHTFAMEERGKPFIVETLKKSCLAPSALRLRKNARVMFVKNNYEAGYVNGTLGTVTDFDEEGWPIVYTASGKRIVASPMPWQITEENKILAEISQVPLRLAWAITVHKSQGMSLDAVEVDLSKSFEKGMGYVALSRVRTLSGLKLLGLNDMALEVNEDILEFDKELQELSEKAQTYINAFSPEQKTALHSNVLELIKPSKRVKKSKVPTHLQTLALIKDKKSLQEIMTQRELTMDTILSHIEKIKKEGISVDLSYFKKEAFTTKKFKKIADAFSVTFEKNGDHRLSPVKEILGDDVSFDELRLARLFL